MDQQAAQGKEKKVFKKHLWGPRLNDVSVSRRRCQMKPVGFIYVEFLSKVSFAIWGISNYRRHAQSKFILKLVMGEKDFLLITPDKKLIDTNWKKKK